MLKGDVYKYDIDVIDLNDLGTRIDVGQFLSYFDIYGRVYVIYYYVDFDYNVERKKLERLRYIIDRLNIENYLMRYGNIRFLLYYDMVFYRIK